MKILLIEDSLEFRVALEKILLDLDSEMEIIRTDKLYEAFDLLKKEEVEIIILDLELTDSNYLNTISRIPELSIYAPVIILTGLIDNDIKQHCINNGCDSFVDKNNLASNPEIIFNLIKLAKKKHRDGLGYRNSLITLKRISEKILNH